jgi:hypothetical protein
LCKTDPGLNEHILVLQIFSITGEQGEKQYVKLFRMKPIILQGTALDMKIVVTKLIHRIL